MCPVDYAAKKSIVWKIESKILEGSFAIAELGD
jgi:hypothetical protein